MHSHTSKQDFFTKYLPHLALSAAILVYVIIVLGGMIRVTGSAGQSAAYACPDWPTCLGQWTPPAGENALINYTHRLLTLLAVPVILLGAVGAWRRYRSQPLIAGGMSVALLLMVTQIGLGAIIALQISPSSAWSSALHLALSLLTEAVLVVATAAAFYQAGRENQNDQQPVALRFHSPFGRLSLLTLTAVFLLLISGTVVAASGAGAACSGWPLCSTGLAPAGPAEWTNLIHRLIVAASGLLLAALLIKGWRTQRTQTPIIVSTTAAAVLFFSQALMGAKLVNGFPAYLLGLHQATAVAVWAALVIQIVTVGLAARHAVDEVAETQTIQGRKGLWRDLLMLTKPIVVVLLLVTTYAGMVIGAQAWPPLSLTIWTLLGGFLAAGGSGAINQYIDRYDDTKMQRTQKRPIPAGRLTPGEGLAFGVGAALVSFYIMVAFVNFLAALLSLAGIIYYVLLYSIFLKKTTVQNIVIGGGAGAIPPLVGWAAATGSLNFPSLFLFAVVFMWTPPHFWALALVRRKDYARAGVPMLPVIRGEVETRWQIFLYTVELVALTLLLPLFGLGGAVYLTGAGLLGDWLLAAAWKVWKQGGNKLAWKMYRYSSMYLAFLFVVLMIDRLL